MNEKLQSRPPQAVVTGGNGNLGHQVALLLAAHPGGSAAVLIANRPSLSSGPCTAVTTAMKAGIVSLSIITGTVVPVFGRG